MNIRLKNYVIGVSWFILSLLSSAANDIMSKYSGLRLPSIEVGFFRFLFGTLSLVPFILYYGKETIKTSHPYVQVARGVLLFFGMISWTYGLTSAPVTTATVISFSIPLFTLVLAVFFLSENIIWQRWLVTIVGFIGIIVTLKPHTEEFNPEVLFFVAAAMAFAILDIINKKFVVKESMICMLFYSALITTILAAPATFLYWQMPTMFELLILMVLGASGNLILYFILKAFSIADATALAPYRYFELIISAIAGYLVFSEYPEKSTIYGALILIPATLFIMYSEKKAINDKNKN